MSQSPHGCRCGGTGEDGCEPRAAASPTSVEELRDALASTRATGDVWGIQKAFATDRGRRIARVLANATSPDPSALIGLRQAALVARSRDLIDQTTTPLPKEALPHGSA